MEPESSESGEAETDMHAERVHKTREKSTDTKYKRSRSSLQLIEDVEKSIAEAQDEPRISQL